MGMLSKFAQNKPSGKTEGQNQMNNMMGGMFKTFGLNKPEEKKEPLPQLTELNFNDI